MLLFLAIACRGDGVPVDLDLDGSPAGVDCDDLDAGVFPGANEICDGLDNDCDGEIDEDPVDLRTWYVDADGDGYGSDGFAVCAPPAEGVRRGGDCDDEDPERHPGRSDVCDGRDNDCDDEVDEDPDRFVMPDADGDGAGDPSLARFACSPEAGEVDAAAAFDCDDAEPAVFPGGVEICDGLDNDCDTIVDPAGTPFLVAPSIPVTIGPTGTPVDGGIFAQPFDLHTASGGTWVDPDHLRLTMGTCDSGLAELPIRFFDDLDAFGVPGTPGDGIGVLVGAWETDGDPTTDEPLALTTDATLWLAPPAGSATATASQLAVAGVRVDFDPQGRGGITVGADLLFDTRVDGPWVATLASPAGVGPPIASSVFLDGHPLVPRVRFTGAGDLDWTTEWVLIAGRPIAIVSSEVVASAPITVTGDPDWTDGLATFAASVSGAGVQTGDFVDLPMASAFLWEGEGARLQDGRIAIAGATGSGVQASFEAGETIGQVVVGLGPPTLHQAFVTGAEGPSGTLRIDVVPPP